MLTRLKHIWLWFGIIPGVGSFVAIFVNIFIANQILFMTLTILLSAAKIFISFFYWIAGGIALYTLKTRFQFHQNISPFKWVRQLCDLSDTAR